MSFFNRDVAKPTPVDFNINVTTYDLTVILTFLLLLAASVSRQRSSVDTSIRSYSNQRSRLVSLSIDNWEAISTVLTLKERIGKRPLERTKQNAALECYNTAERKYTEGGSVLIY